MITHSYKRMLKSRPDEHRLEQLPCHYHHPNTYKIRGRKRMNLRLTGRKQQGIYRLVITLVERFEMYGQKIRKRQDYTMNIGTMTADDLHSPEKYITDEYLNVILYPQVYDGCKGFPKGMRSVYYLGGLTGRTSTAFNWAIRSGAASNRPFNDCWIPAKVYETPYFLTIEERYSVHEMDLSDATTLVPYRDVIMFQCLVGCRYGDLVRLTSDNIVSGGVEYIPNRTREKNPRTVRVSHNEKVRTVLERLQSCQRTRTLVPHNSGSSFSTVTRKLIILAGITRDIPGPNTKEVQGNHETDQRNRGQPHNNTGVHGNLYSQVKDPEPVAPMSSHAEGSHVFAGYRTTDDGLEMEQVNLTNQNNNK